AAVQIAESVAPPDGDEEMVELMATTNSPGIPNPDYFRRPAPTLGWRDKQTAPTSGSGKSDGRAQDREAELREIIEQTRRESERLFESTLERVTDLVKTPSGVQDGLNDVLNELREITNAFNGQHRSISELFEAMETSITYCQQTVEKLIR